MQFDFSKQLTFFDGSPITYEATDEKGDSVQKPFTMQRAILKDLDFLGEDERTREGVIKIGNLAGVIAQGPIADLDNEQIELVERAILGTGNASYVHTILVYIDTIRGNI